MAPLVATRARRRSVGRRLLRLSCKICLMFPAATVFNLGENQFIYGSETHINIPIVLLQPGHEVRGVPAVRSCKKHRFLYFSEALSWLSMALNDCFFFQLARNTQSTFGDVLVQRWHWKRPDLSDSPPMPKSSVSCHRSGSVVLT